MSEKSEWVAEKNAQDRGIVIGIGVPLVLLAMGLTLSGINQYYDAKLRAKEQCRYSEVYDRASKMADTNKDGFTSVDEGLRMYEEMGIRVRFPEGTRKPTIGELESYIAKHRGESQK